jgi:hypothetical protein
MHKEDAGKKYRPSNGTEGEYFMSMWCYRCQSEKDYEEEKAECCMILLNTMAFTETEPGYPQEWQYDTDGQPICTAFRQAMGTDEE